MTKKYFFLNEEQMKQLQTAYRNTNDKKDKTFDLLVDINTNQKLTKETVRNISQRLDE